MIWTVTESDKVEWAAHSGYGQTSRIKGLGFTGEQYIPGARGNSIVVLYNNASNLGIHYQIVKHGTFDEMPLVLSFISTDIDAAQGVQTNLANITEIIPKESNLIKKDGIIYDGMPGVEGLNGSSDLPKGGYLGAGFLSNFDYIFYSPAPERVSDSYLYPIAVRYDIFGSSLQANLLPRLKNHIRVNYLDENHQPIKPSEQFTGYHDEKYFIQSVAIPKYKLVNIQKDEGNPNYPIIDFIYRPIYKVNLRFLDEGGQVLGESQTYSVEKGQQVSYIPPVMSGYEVPARLDMIVDRDIDHIFIYKKIEPVLKPEEKPEKIEEEKKPDKVKSKPEPEGVKPVRPPRLVRDSYQPSKNDTIWIVPQETKQVFPLLYQPIKIKLETPTIKLKMLPPLYFKPIKDPFLVNTGMSLDEKIMFLGYIREVARRSRAKHGSNVDKVNHDVANAIAYSVYHEDFLQNLTNDFGERPRELSNEVYDFFRNNHEKKQYIIDFPHLAAPLATAEKSSWWKETVKFIAGISPWNLFGESPGDILFMNNSMTGDLLTYIDTKDELTNMDAYIFRYHPDFKDLPLDKRIEFYYSLDHLEDKRKILYKQALDMRKGNKPVPDYEVFINYFSALSFAGAGIYLMNKTKKLFKKIGKLLEGTSARNKKGHGELIGKVMSGKQVRAGLNLSVNGRQGIRNLAKPIYRQVVKPVVKLAKQVVKPLVNHLVKPIYKRVVKPVAKSLNHYVVAPLNKRVIKPLVKNVVKLFVKPVYKKVVQPVYQQVVRPVRNLMRQKIVKPIGRFFRGIFK